MSRKRVQVRFTLDGSAEVFGELQLKGRRSLLRLTSNERLPWLQGQAFLLGESLDGRKISCIDCVRLSQSWSSEGDATARHHAELFPHFVVIGAEHVDPSAAVVRNVRFEVTDISTLFYDYDAFGMVFEPGDLMDSVLAELRSTRAVEVGEMPRVAYFTGKVTVIEVDTEIGKILVTHRPSGNFGGPDGVFIKNRMCIVLEVASAVTFDKIIDRMLTVTRFLSIVAGREQGITDICIGTMPYNGDVVWTPLRVSWSNAPRMKASRAVTHRPHPADIPLDPVSDPGEYSIVLRNWIEREKSWRVPRVRYANCLNKGDMYDADRLIAAANMFDILPAAAQPARVDLSEELAKAKVKCQAVLEKLLPDYEAERVIAELGRMGKPSLPKKVQHRAALVTQHFGARFNELPFALRVAIKYRNFLVHGGDFDIEAAEPFKMFLTDALEFVFAASDLIDAGWDASKWARRSHSIGHTFARFRSVYNVQMDGLKKAFPSLYLNFSTQSRNATFS